MHHILDWCITGVLYAVSNRKLFKRISLCNLSIMFCGHDFDF